MSESLKKCAIAILMFCVGVNLMAQSAVKSGAFTTTNVPENANVDAVTGDSTTSAFRIFNAANTELLHVSPTGQVGIGTSAPAALFHLSAPEYTSIRLTHTQASSPESAIYFYEGANLQGFINQRGSTSASQASNFNIGTQASGGSVVFFTSLGERLRIAADGNVGIGTASPQVKLHVLGGDMHLIGGTAKGAIMTSLSSTNPVLMLRTGDVNGYYPELRFTGETSMPIGSVMGWKGSALLISAAPNHGLGFRTNGSLADAMAINTLGNVGIGAAPTATARLHVGGDATFTGTVSGGNIQAKYQDVAEWVPATSDMEPGTVVVLNPRGRNEVMPSHRAYDTRVAGVVSAQPGVILGEAGANKEQIATTGRVRVRVDAAQNAIEVGDLLVTSNVPGMAMKSMPMDVNGRPFHQPGTIPGKALEPLAGGKGEILVLLSMQ
jgi:hypothetical protein